MSSCIRGIRRAAATGLHLSVVIPVYNEHGTLPRILRATMLIAPTIAKEFIIVDDYSLDGTREWLKAVFPKECHSVKGVRRCRGRVEFLFSEAACAELQGDYELFAAPLTVRVVFHEKNGGKGRALSTGFASVTGDVIAISAPVGAATWGSRFTTTPVILISMLAVPLLLMMRARLSRLEKAAAVIVIGLATVVQLLSVTFWYELEEAQTYATGGFIGMRLVNLLAIALHKFQDWHLATGGVEPRYLKLNFVPFLMDKYVSASLAHKMQLIWSAAVFLALAAAVRLTLLCRIERLANLKVPVSLLGAQPG